MKYMHAIGQHERLSLANGLLQMLHQADKLRTVLRGMPGVKKKKKKKGYSNLKIENLWLIVLFTLKSFIEHT